MADKYTSTYIDKNNVVGGVGATHSAASIEQITETYQHFDFGLRWTGADAGVSLASAPWVGLDDGSTALGSDSFNVGPYSGSPISVKWVAGTLAGTIKEQFYSGATLISSATRDNVDPGFGAVDTSGATAPIGRPGPRYRFELFDVYYRIFIIGEPKPRAAVPAPSTGFVLPIRLLMYAPANVLVHNVEAGGSLLPSAIYTKEAQTADGVTTPVYARIYQKSRYSGIQGAPTDLVIP